MTKPKPKKKSTSPFVILRSALSLFKVENQQILYPFITIVFISLLTLEILYFLPRYPLSIFFNTIIGRIWGEAYLHYPMNLSLLPKMFYYVQTAIYLFISGFLISIIIPMIAAFNNDERVSFKASLKKALPSYIYIFLYTVLILLLLQVFDSLYGLVIKRALKIHSTSGIFFMIKKAVFIGAPYFQFLYSIFITALFAYIPILILLEKKRFLGAFIGNFKMIFRSFWLTITIVLIPTLFYLPVLLLHDNIGKLIEITSPEIQIASIIVSIFLTNTINIFVTAAATTYYLYKKEHS
mgnify:CR=1 FL=1